MLNLKVMQWSFGEKTNAVKLRGLAADGALPIEYQLEGSALFIFFAGKNSQNCWVDLVENFSAKQILVCVAANWARCPWESQPRRH